MATLESCVLSNCGVGHWQRIAGSPHFDLFALTFLMAIVDSATTQSALLRFGSPASEVFAYRAEK